MKKQIFTFSVVLMLGVTTITTLAQPAGGGSPKGNQQVSGKSPQGNPQVDGGTDIDTSLPSPLKYKTIPDLFTGIAKFLVNISVPIATIMVLFGAFQILTAGSNPEKVTTGRQTILYAVIGLAIILLGWVISALISELLGARNPAFHTAPVVDLDSAQRTINNPFGDKAVPIIDLESAPTNSNQFPGGTPIINLD